jgi:hypothetical protein
LEEIFKIWISERPSQFAASLMFFQLQHTLNTIWKIPPPKRGETSAYVRKRLLALVMVLGVGLFLIAATLVNLVLSTFSSYFDLDIAAAGITFLSHVGLATVALALLYKVLPDAEVTWRDVWVDSAVTAILTMGGATMNRWRQREILIRQPDVNVVGAEPGWGLHMGDSGACPAARCCYGLGARRVNSAAFRAPPCLSGSWMGGRTGELGLEINRSLDRRRGLDRLAHSNPPGPTV